MPSNPDPNWTFDTVRASVRCAGPPGVRYGGDQCLLAEMLAVGRLLVGLIETAYTHAQTAGS